MKALPAAHRLATNSGARSRLVIVPGLHGSGAGHWQSWLQGQIAEAVRVEQAFWSVPDIERWADRVAETVDALGPGPHVLAAHSFGCLAAVHATARYPGLGVARMLLVAPAEPTRFNVANLLPQARLAMPTCLVASDNDPWMSAAHANEWAQRWGSDWVNLGHAGHINVDSGYGPFPLAREWVACALNRLALAALARGRMSAPDGMMQACVPWPSSPKSSNPAPPMPIAWTRWRATCARWDVTRVRWRASGSSRPPAAIARRAPPG